MQVSSAPQQSEEEIQPLAIEESPIPTRERRLREERKRLEKGLPRKKDAPRKLGVRYLSTLQLDIVTSEALKIAAWQRHVSMTSLISDILGLWVVVACDFEQDIYRSRMPLGVRPMAVPERWQGYLASLGFKRAVEAQARAYAAQEESGVMQEEAVSGSEPNHAVPPPVEQPSADIPQEVVAPPPPQPAAHEAVSHPVEAADSGGPDSRGAEGDASATSAPLQSGSDFQAPTHRIAQPRPGEEVTKPIPAHPGAIRGFEPPDDEELFREKPPGVDDFPLPVNAQRVPKAQDPL